MHDRVSPLREHTWTPHTDGHTKSHMQEYECTHSGDEHGHARTHILYIQVNAYKRANILCYTSQKYFFTCVKTNRSLRKEAQRG